MVDKEWILNLIQCKCKIRTINTKTLTTLIKWVCLLVSNFNLTNLVKELIQTLINNNPNYKKTLVQVDQTTLTTKVKISEAGKIAQICHHKTKVELWTKTQCKLYNNQKVSF